MTVNKRPLFDAWMYIMVSFLLFFQPWMMAYYEVNGTFWVNDIVVNAIWVLPLVTVFFGFQYITGWVYPGFFNPSKTG